MQSGSGETIQIGLKDAFLRLTSTRDRLEEHARGNVGARLRAEEVTVRDELETPRDWNWSVTHRRDGLVNLFDLGLVDASNVGQQVGNVAL